MRVDRGPVHRYAVLVTSLPTGAHTGPSPARAGDRGRRTATAVVPPVAGLGPAWSARRRKGGDPVTYAPTVICEVVAS